MVDLNQMRMGNIGGRIDSWALLDRLAEVGGCKWLPVGKWCVSGSIEGHTASSMV